MCIDPIQENTMKTRSLVFSALTATLLAVSTASPAATSSDGNQPPSAQNESRNVKSGGEYERGPWRMRREGREGQENMPGRWGGRMYDGMMSGPMAGIMGNCGMPEQFSGANAKVLMQMHGEMMRAMGDIMMKYADKFQAPTSP
jgi:hypothetical protein